ncbi:hypothetical protein LIER_33462 [Lithospermum erythrorhizon]|uniref:Uncharacterized protein n=1 Tax=Lithospermum erythrorhizon TaxID=34254 RepID=A0AAV3RXQ4_LITER
MAFFGNSSAKTTILAFLAMTALYISAVMAQDSAMAPSPTMVTGDGFAFPVSGVLVSSSMLVALVALMFH